MKYVLIAIFTLLSGASLFASCEDDLALFVNNKSTASKVAAATTAVAATAGLAGCHNPLAVDDLLGGKTINGSTMDLGRAYFLDSQGRVTFYHGFNVANAAKYADDMLPWQTQQDFRRMKEEWGMNAIRLLVFWSGIEPNQDQYNQDYLNGLIDIIQFCKDEGIDVIVDFHKDVFGESFTEQGFPHWVTQDDQIVFTESGGYWSENYMHPAVLRSFYNFWNSSEMKAEYIEMLRDTLLTFQQAGLTNIIGVDPMNEPFPHEITNVGPSFFENVITIIRDVDNVIEFEEDYLSPFYDAVKYTMENAGLNYRMFFEPWISTSSGIPSYLNYQAAPSDAYFPHFYQTFIYNGAEYQSGSAHQTIIDNAIKIKADEAKKMQVPLAIGEFGIDVERPGAIDYINDTFDIFEKYGASWFYYSYDIHSGGFSPINSDGSEKDAMRKAFVRVYAQKIAGRNIEQSRTRTSYNLEYDLYEYAEGPTEIFIPSHISDVKITINGQTHRSSGSQFLYNNPETGRQRISITWTNP